jgi:O-antigen/teichoic acid export membrane protein
MSLKKQTLWSIAPLVVVTALNIVSVPLFYRYLGAELYALWFYVLTFTGAFGFMDLGLGVAVGRYIGVALGRSDVQAVREYWGTGNAIAIPLLSVMGIIFGAIGVMFGPKWFNVDPSLVVLLRWSFVAGGFGLFLSFYGQFWNILSQAHLDYRFVGSLRTIFAVIQIGVALILAVWKRNPLILIVWTSIVAALQLLFYVVHARATYGLGFALSSRSWARAREMFSYTIKTFVALISGAIFGSIDRLILGRLAPPSDFAHYSIAANVGARVQGLSTAVMGPVFCNTSISLAEPRGAARIYNETFSFTFGWYLHLALWGLVWHSLFLSLWLGPEVGRQVGVVFPILMVGYCLNAIANISASQLGPLNRVGTQAVFQIMTGVLTAIGVYVGWKMFGLVGVAYGYLLGRIGDIAQDIYVLTLIGGGGWLAKSTWKMVASQAALAFAFYLAYRVTPAGLTVPIILAIVHGLGMAVFLIIENIRSPIVQLQPNYPSPSSFAP